MLLDPPADCKLSRLEVFGPVVCVYTYDALDEAIGRANALPVAFQAAIFTRDYGTAMRAYTRLDASAVMLNDHTAFRSTGCRLRACASRAWAWEASPTHSATCRLRSCLWDPPGHDH